MKAFLNHIEIKKLSNKEFLRYIDQLLLKEG